MLEKKKRKGRGSTSPVPTPSAGASIASPSLEFDEPLDRESEDDFNETDPTKQLLSKLPQSNWLQRRVRVLAGPSKGKTGTTFKGSNNPSVFLKYTWFIYLTCFLILCLSSLRLGSRLYWRR